MRLTDVLRTYEHQLRAEHTNTTFTITGLIPELHGQPDGVLFDPQHTNYGLLLQGSAKNKNIDAAIIGFNEYENHIDCLEIHGGRNRYTTLKAIDWDYALLDSLISVAQETHKDAVHLIPAIHIDGVNRNNIERLERRYDINAKAHGFTFSKQHQRYVLDL